MNIKARRIIPLVVLTTAVLAVFWQVQDFKFVYYDDATYVVEKPQVMAGLTWDGVAWALTATENGFWHPVTWLSLMMDRQLYRNNPGGFHWTNVQIHLLNTLLLFFFLRAATGREFRSAAAAFLFAVHPLHVEPVAWVAQRKELLSALFGFSALWAYVPYARDPRPKRYLVVLMFFILGLMSKPMIVTLPLIMLLLDFWPLERHKATVPLLIPEGLIPDRIAGKTRVWAGLALEKTPFLILSLIASIVVLHTEEKVGALSLLKELTFWDRFSNAAVSYVKYLFLTFWPTDLAFLYLHPGSTPLLYTAGALISLAAVSGGVWSLRGVAPFLVTGWFWYLITLLPVCGIVQVGPHALADRYTYVPLVGIFVAVVWGLSALAAKGRLLRWFILTAAAFGAAALMHASWLQTATWRNSESLFRQALKVDPDNYVALHNFGLYLANTGRFEEGVSYLTRAILAKPGYNVLYYSTGNVLYQRGECTRALPYLLKAEEMGFADDGNRRMIGDCLRRTGRPGESLPFYHKAIAANEKNPENHYGLALTLLELGRLDDALRHLRAALNLDEKHLKARKTLMALAFEMGDTRTVLEEGRRALANGAADEEMRHLIERARLKEEAR
ncbi:MAG TPA: tetratricopeptide repeat protein [Syntrophales bacterium]|nr:tetratricopeptide repeat protein [Syntrophales bacterium]HOM07703.1 tetratricopeptide repeat protein [Syntrophales bacterium]HPQ07227.1 tetratricopeptide repeat protein [Syntrophales bacterium]